MGRAAIQVVMVMGFGWGSHGCSAQSPAPALAPNRSRVPVHDPDRLRGELPATEARHLELAAIRASLDAMYAHRLSKERRYGIDEAAAFADADAQLAAATTWARYDAVLYRLVARFHDDHLSYHPPVTAAPARGYDSYLLGLTTVVVGDRLLIASVEPEVAALGIGRGDEVVEIDGRSVATVLAEIVESEVWSRSESAKAAFSHRWTSVLYPKGDPPRTRHLAIRQRIAGATVAITLVPRQTKTHRESVTMVITNAIATVTIRSLDKGRDRARKIDDSLASARATARGLVIDLRGDRGGVDLVGYRIVGDLVEGTASLGTYRVLTAPETIARRPRWKHLAGTSGSDGFSPPQPLTVVGQAVGQGFHGPISVVIDSGCASTCEVVAAALRADLHAVLVGETTAGSSGAPVEVTLPVTHGAIAIPTWDFMSADGRAIEGEGVVPDVAVAGTAESLAAGHDAQLDAALDDVRSRLPP